MKLVLLGQSRTGTMSIWNMFKYHPEVSVSVPKEYLAYRDDLSDYINKAYHVTNRTKVLLDGSPNIFYKTKRMERAFKTIEESGLKDVYQIYTIRDPIEQIVSMMHIRIRHFIRTGELQPLFFDGEDIIGEEIHKVCLHVFNEYDLVMRADRLIGKSNIFFVKLEEFKDKQQEIFKFLGVDHTKKYKFEKSNTTWELGYDIKLLKIKGKIQQYIKSRMDEYRPIIEESKRKMNERYGI